MARKDYWTRRALADEAAADRLARRAAEEMRRAYREQYEAVLREIEGLYAQIAEGGAPTRTQLWSYARWRRLEERLRELSGETARQCERTVTDCLNEVFRTVIGAEAGEMAGWEASISPRSVLETAWSGEHYSARVWRNTAAVAQRVQEDMTEIIVQGKSFSQARRRLMEDFSVAYSEADRLVRTEAAYVRNQAALARYRHDRRRRVRWITGESDGRECATCRDRDGQEYDIDSAPRLPAHPNCRCCYAPVVEAGADAEAPEEAAADKLAAHLQRNAENDIIAPSTTDGGGSVNVIGEITNEQVMAYWKGAKPRVVLTEERIEHIREGHAEDFDAFSSYIPATIRNPAYVLCDAKNENTAMFIGRVEQTNINVIIKLAFEDASSDLESSVITMYRLGEKTLRRLIKKNSVVYRREGT